MFTLVDKIVEKVLPSCNLLFNIVRLSRSHKKHTVHPEEKSPGERESRK